MIWEVLDNLMKQPTASYIIVKTKFTKHHIERLSSSQRDRGKWKWIAETTNEGLDRGNRTEEARRSHIDSGDCFPRFYFLDQSLREELRAWCVLRDVEVIDIKAPRF